MILGRPTVTALVLSIPWLVSCGTSRAEVAPAPVTIRISAGVSTGTFGPFSESLVRGYAELLPDLRIELVDTPGSVRNLEALENGAVDLGLAQAGVAYMAYNGRLPDSDRPLGNIRGVAVLNSSTVHLLVGPQSRARSIDNLKGLRVGIGPIGTGSAVTSELLLSPFLKGMDPERAPATPIPLHRGATLYYREQELRR